MLLLLLSLLLLLLLLLLLELVVVELLSIYISLYYSQLCSILHTPMLIFPSKHMV